MSPVFRHGRLRLYLLKLLDESPRHGYEVIRLLQDRFMGVYAPSPGTIYPRLARLEEDGLVTHEEVNGRKVYSITDKGREEIRSRIGDLADLEDELSESLRDVAREISEDVRDTVKSIREEIASAARELRHEGGRAPGAGASTGSGGDAGAGTGESRRLRDEARRSREQMRAGFRRQGRSFGDRSWASWADSSAWGAWADWTGERKAGPDSDTAGSDTAGSDTPDSGTADSAAAASGTAGSGTSATDAGTTDTSTTDTSADSTATGAGAGSNAADSGSSGSTGRGRRGSQNPFGDLERLAMQFATELRATARQTGDLGERSLNDLRDILTDTLARVRTEVFRDTSAGGDSRAGRTEESQPPDQDDTEAE